jgi:hypothetical protein
VWRKAKPVATVANSLMELHVEIRPADTDMVGDEPADPKQGRTLVYGEKFQSAFCHRIIYQTISVALSPQANYTD